MPLLLCEIFMMDVLHIFWYDFFMSIFARVYIGALLLFIWYLQLEDCVSFQNAGWRYANPFLCSNSQIHIQNCWCVLIIQDRMWFSHRKPKNKSPRHPNPSLLYPKLKMFWLYIHFNTGDLHVNKWIPYACKDCWIADLLLNSQSLFVSVDTFLPHSLA